MSTHADKTQENKNQSVANGITKKQGSSKSTFQFFDNRPEAVAQRKLQDMANNSPQAKQAAQLQAMANDHSSKQQPIQKKENNTGLPDTLKTGMENLSGMSLDDVKVHRNSDKPAQLQAHAYAQGTDIHLAPGQEKHLPHEAWHVVQQKQGRVKPTMQMKGGVNVNDDKGLEKEADVMGAKALTQMKPNANENLRNTLAVGGLIQLKWIGDGGPVLIWDRQLDGLRWFYNLETDKMYYEIEDIPGKLAYLRQTEGIKHERTHAEWIKAGFGPGQWSQSDAEIVPFIPTSEEKIKLGNTNREMTRGSLEQQATEFVKSTASGNTKDLFWEFRQQIDPIIKVALTELQKPEGIHKNVISRLVDVYTSYEKPKESEKLKDELEQNMVPTKKLEGKAIKRHEKNVSRAKSDLMIKTYMDSAVKDMIEVAKIKLKAVLEQIVKKHGAEDYFDALTAATNLLKRFAKNTNMNHLHQLVEIYNLVRARLLALDIRKDTPIVIKHKPLQVSEFSRVAPSLKLGSSLIELEGNYDVLSRRTGAVTNEDIIHVHEVDLAFVKIFQGVTEAYANPTSKDNDKLAFGGGGGVGEKVFAADHKGSMDFRDDVKKREERFYGLIFPKGFIQHFGMDIRDKRKFDPVGPENSKLKGSVREPNETELTQHLMPPLNGDPAVKIPLSKLFFIRAETSTPGGQVDIHFGWRDMVINDKKMHHPDFFRQYVLGVVEFTKNGLIIRYQKLS
ncbi:MAG: DUF4157 domain-containing protein [Bacteroidota bacterium]